MQENHTTDKVSYLYRLGFLIERVLLSLMLKLKLRYNSFSSRKVRKETSTLFPQFQIHMNFVVFLIPNAPE